MKGTRTRVAIGGVLHTGRELDVYERVVLPDFAAFRFPQPLEVQLTVRRVGGGLELKGTVDGSVGGECGRCLEDVEHPVHVDFAERFDPTGESNDPLAEANVLAGDELDLQDLVRQLIDSALPIVLVCSDCPGLCAECGQKRDGSCRCAHPE